MTEVSLTPTADQTRDPFAQASPAAETVGDSVVERPRGGAMSPGRRTVCGGTAVELSDAQDLPVILARLDCRRVGAAVATLWFVVALMVGPEGSLDAPASRMLAIFGPGGTPAQEPASAPA